MEAKIVKTRWGTNEIRLGKTWVPDETGELAIRFATHFGLIAAQTEGEDTNGRAKIELQPVDMVVDRACEMAEKLVAKLKEKKWVVDLPDIPEEEADGGTIDPPLGIGRPATDPPTGGAGTGKPEPK